MHNEIAGLDSLCMAWSHSLFDSKTEFFILCSAIAVKLAMQQFKSVEIVGWEINKRVIQLKNCFPDMKMVNAIKVHRN